MAYSSPVITSSSVDFAAFQADSLSGLAEAIAVANSLTAGQKAVMHRMLLTDEKVQHFSQVVSGFLRGDPISTVDVTAAILSYATVFGCLFQTANEIGILVDANSGTIQTSYVLNSGLPYQVRVFS